MKKYIVEVKNVTKKYGSITAVNDVSFKISDGEFFSLLGPSGCGKTTILRIIGGFIDQDEGKVTIDNEDMIGVSPNKRNTSMVFQNLALFPHMNVEENIIYGLKKRKIPAVEISKKLNNMLSIVNLAGLKKRRINELSGGQQQRVALARSLIIEPKILLLYEPLASLDKKLRISMRAELKEIQKRTGATFLYVTHDQSEALTMSDTISVMNDGKIVQSGQSDWIYNNPADLFVADFIGAGNFIPIWDVVFPGKDIVKALTKTGGEITIRKNLRPDYGPESENDTNPFQIMTARIKNNIASKQDLVFFIRPEKIKVSSGSLWKVSDAAAPLNRFEAKIISRIFEGPDIRIRLFSEKIGLITAEIKNDAAHENFTENNPAYIYWDSREGIIL
ncbi:MAG: ABC transporter ATP-binding protein [Actinobacteria bacterium]|nr:ABC transporter ATP-binding protein [Actinomycetota bacterium]